METKEAQPTESKTKDKVEEPVKADEPPAPSEVLKNAKTSLDEWQDVVEPATILAKDLLYYAEELYCEDKQEWTVERFKVLRDKLSVDQYDKDVEALNKKQAPIWDILLDKEATLRAKIDAAHDKVKSAHADVKKSLTEDPLNRKFMNPLAKVFGKALHEDQQELLHHYECMLKRKFGYAQEAYVNLCGYPSGYLTRVKLLRANAIKEGAHVTDEIHKKKGVVHEITSPEPVAT